MSSYYWSSTTCTYNTVYVWAEHFGFGGGPLDTCNNCYVRAVRNVKSGTSKIPDTGQNTSYTDTFGEDSDYTINTPSYTKLDASGNALADDATNWAMVRDNVTGLIWEVKTDDGGIRDKDNTYTWQEAQDVFIAKLNNENFGGHSDWRFPTVKELSMLVHADKWYPTINTAYFLNTMSHFFWSSTTCALSSDLAWHVNFGVGYVRFQNKSDNLYVRAVRGEESQGKFVDNGDGTVTDTKSGLMWQQSETVRMTWNVALSYCKNLQLANHNDWRLPNRNELQSLVDYSKCNLAIDTMVFPDTMLANYISSTACAYDSNYVWTVHFNCQGDTVYPGPMFVYRFYVRAVRNIQ